jgi:hypothetical protein
MRPVRVVDAPVVNAVIVLGAVFGPDQQLIVEHRVEL